LDEVVIKPWLQFNSPVIAFKSVDFPDPTTPTTIVNDPALHERVTSLIAGGASGEGRITTFWIKIAYSTVLLGPIFESSMFSCSISRLLLLKEFNGIILSSTHGSERRNPWILSKQPTDIAMSGRAWRKFSAGVVNNVMMTSEENVWLVDSLSDPFTDACIAKMTKAAAGPMMLGTKAINVSDQSLKCKPSLHNNMRNIPRTLNFFDRSSSLTRCPWILSKR